VFAEQVVNLPIVDFLFRQGDIFGDYKKIILAIIGEESYVGK
jgi:hypothetical protein